MLELIELGLIIFFVSVDSDRESNRSACQRHDDDVRTRCRASIDTRTVNNDNNNTDNNKNNYNTFNHIDNNDNTNNNDDNNHNHNNTFYHNDDNTNNNHDNNTTFNHIDIDNNDDDTVNNDGDNTVVTPVVNDDNFYTDAIDPYLDVNIDLSLGTSYFRHCTAAIYHIDSIFGGRFLADSSPPITV